MNGIEWIVEAKRAETRAKRMATMLEWLAEGKFRLLIGQPGAGKSSLLRFMATDLLSPEPQSVALQREHGTDLPIWLPFGFLCRHLEASTENSLPDQLVTLMNFLNVTRSGS